MHILYTVKPVLTTTSEQRPPVNNDHPKSRPNKLSTKTTSEQRPPVNYDQRPPKFGPNFIKTCLQRPFCPIFDEKFKFLDPYL
jgi:hypothetical protein